MVGAAEQAVIAKSLGALLVVVKGVEEENGGGALIKSRQGTPVGGQAESLPLVLKGLVQIDQITIFRKPNGNSWKLAGSDALDLRTHGILSVGVKGEHPHLLHQFLVFQNRVAIIIRDDRIIGDCQSDVAQSFLLQPARHSLQSFRSFLRIDPWTLRRVAVRFVERAEVLEVDMSLVARVLG